MNRSPLFALLGETIDGVATIRAFSAQNALIQRLTKSLDTQQHAYYLTFTSLCWLAVRLEMIGTAIIAFACLCSVLEHDSINGDEVLAGLYGLSISYALSITGSLNWSVRMASDFEANMVAVERVKDYCLIQSEADRHTPADEIAEKTKWPSDGQITFAGAKLRYRPNLPLVLKGLDIDIPASSKVGVVARTGKFHLAKNSARCSQCWLHLTNTNLLFLLASQTRCGKVHLDDIVAPTCRTRPRADLD